MKENKLTVAGDEAACHGQKQEMKYILVIIDAFSRFAYTAPLKFKTAQESAEAMDKIFQKFKFPPVMFTSDKGMSILKL